MLIVIVFAGEVIFRVGVVVALRITFPDVLRKGELSPPIRRPTVGDSARGSGEEREFSEPTKLADKVAMVSVREAASNEVG